MVGKHIIAFVGMPGAGKSEVAKYLQNVGFQYLRFGQIVLDIAIKNNCVNEQGERKIREALREQYGMAAIAKLSIPKIKKLILKGNIVIDDLYSWEEYTLLKKMFGDKLIIVAVLASPKIRHERLTKRAYDPKKDKKAIHRPLTKNEAISRDISKIENLHQGGPIAMADYYLVNEGKKDKMVDKLKEILKQCGI